MQAVTQVREFNRFYTGVIGVLTEHLLRTPYTLTEARVIFELAQGEESEVAEVRRRLDLDPGYLSRILTRFSADGLVVRRRAAADARRQLVALTEAGRDVWRTLDQRSSEEISALLGRLDADGRDHLLGAMGAIRDLLGGGRTGPARADAPATAPTGPGEVVLREPYAGDLGWIVQRHGALYAAEYGFDATFEGMVAGIVARFAAGHDPRRERVWIAERDGRRLGCVACVRDDTGTDTDSDTARLRLLLVEPSARGSGLGRLLVDECLRFARHAGYRRMVLYTLSLLVDARRLYQRAGFRLADSRDVSAHGRDMQEQTWSRTLGTPGSGR